MKKFLKILSYVIAAVILLFAGCFGWFKYQEAGYAATAVPYIKQNLPIIAQWNKETAKTFMTPAALKETSEADLEKLFNWFKKLGALRSIEEPQLVNVYSGVDLSGPVKILTYNVPAHFEAGDGVIMLRLVDLGAGKYKVQALNVNSSALAG